jgi:hypothetical protein
MLDTIDKLTEPTTCILLDGTGINVELALGKVFPFQKACHSVCCGATYLCVGQCGSPPSVPIDGGDIAT